VARCDQHFLSADMSYVAIRQKQHCTTPGRRWGWGSACTPILTTISAKCPPVGNWAISLFEEKELMPYAREHLN